MTSHGGRAFGIRLTVGTAVLAGLAMAELPAQERVRISDTPECPRCTIALAPVAQIGDPTGPGTIDHMQSRAVRTKGGSFLLIGNYSTSIKLFNPDGSFARAIGREGQGPGEFQGIGAIRLGEGDSLHVFDNMNRRHSVFSPNLDFVRSVVLPLPPELEVAAIGRGRWVFNASIRTPNQIGLPLHLVAEGSRLVRSFGSETGVYRPDIPFLMSRAIAPAGRSQIWSAHPTQYVIDLIDVESGELVKQLVREAPWFPPRVRPVPRGPSPPRPDPFVLGVRQDATGLLWIMIGVQGSNWQAAVRSPTERSPHGEVLDEQAFRNTRIEVIDPVRGRLVAATETSLYIRFMLDSDLIGTTLMDDEDTPRFHVWRLGLVQP